MALSALGCASRRERLWKSLPAPCDFLIVGDPGHLVYFVDYTPSPFVFRTVESGAVLLLEPDRATLVADDMLRPFLDRAFADEVIAPIWYDGKHAAGHRRVQLVESVLDRIAKMNGTRVGIELASVPAGVLEGLRWARPGIEVVDIGPIIRPLRRAKDTDEIEVLRRSMRAGEAGLAAALLQVKPGMTELDAYHIVQNAAICALGAQAIVYGDFVSGPRCEIERGGPPTARTIELGDLLLLDFSVVVDGYRGDFTNTFTVGAKPTPRQRDLFEACLEALRAGEAQLRAGALARNVDVAVRGYFDSLGLGGAFPSHSGHGLGLGHPEPPYLVPESDEVLQAGDVVALEPGLYVEGTGGMRYERNYLVTVDGFETLSNHELRIEQ
jgi:Xaa-Pro aminopeptidase